MAGKRHIKLGKPRDVQKFISKLINQRLRDEVDSATSRDCGYLAKILLDTFDAVEMEERLTELENKIGINNNQNIWTKKWLSIKNIGLINYKEI